MVGLFEQRETEQQQKNQKKISDSQVFFIQVMIWD